MQLTFFQTPGQTVRQMTKLLRVLIQLTSWVWMGFQALRVPELLFLCITISPHQCKLPDRRHHSLCISGLPLHIQSSLYRLNSVHATSTEWFYASSCHLQFYYTTEIKTFAMWDTFYIQYKSKIEHKVFYSLNHSFCSAQWTSHKIMQHFIFIARRKWLQRWNYLSINIIIKIWITKKFLLALIAYGLVKVKDATKYTKLNPWDHFDKSWPSYKMRTHHSSYNNDGNVFP